MQITARGDGRSAAFYLATPDELSRLGERYLRRLEGGEGSTGFRCPGPHLDRDPPFGYPRR